MDEIYQNREERAKELREQGTKVVGYYCCFVPPEMIEAAGFFPFRLMGDIFEPITRADVGLEVNLCPYIRSTLDVGMKGKVDFLDGLIVPHTCDAIQRIYRLWKYYVPQIQWSHYLDVPHMMLPDSHQFFQEELGFFKKKLEGWAGKEISEESLRERIRVRNQTKRLIRELYELRKPDPPLISGREVTELIVSGMSISAEEFNDLLRGVIDGAKARADRPEKKSARILVWGSELDHSEFVKIIEGCGAHVVMDDLCIGTRQYWPLTDEKDEPLHALTMSYYSEITCPRQYKGPGTERFEYLIDYAKEFDANAVILYTMHYCDPHALDIPDLRDYLQENGYPTLHLEDDYSGIATLGQFRTRIQAFLEMIS